MRRLSDVYRQNSPEGGGAPPDLRQSAQKDVTTVTRTKLRVYELVIVRIKAFPLRR